MKPKSQLHSRPAHRDDVAVQSIVDLFDDIDAAQAIIDQDESTVAKTVVKNAVNRFREKVIDSSIKDLQVYMNAVGRLEVFLDYADDLGVIRTTYTARKPVV